MADGQHGERRRELSAAAAKKSAAARRRSAPLRPVVGKELDGDDVVELLACGHKMRPPAGLYGSTSAKRRRCLDCLDQIEQKNSQKKEDS